MAELEWPPYHTIYKDCNKDWSWLGRLPQQPLVGAFLRRLPCQPMAREPMLGGRLIGFWLGLSWECYLISLRCERDWEGHSVGLCWSLAEEAALNASGLRLTNEVSLTISGRSWVGGSSTWQRHFIWSCFRGLWLKLSWGDCLVGLWLELDWEGCLLCLWLGIGNGGCILDAITSIYIYYGNTTCVIHWHGDPGVEQHSSSCCIQVLGEVFCYVP